VKLVSMSMSRPYRLTSTPNILLTLEMPS